MSDEVVYINDPLGHTICVTKEIFTLQLKEVDKQDLYDDFLSVIRKPALLIEISGDPLKLYYFRSIGWDFSALIKTLQTGDCWQTYACIVNPDHQYVVELLKTGKQII